MTEIIAEVGLQHDGSLREALSFVRACAAIGVDIVKFQDHLADTNHEFRPGTEHHFPQDENRAAYWRRTCFPTHQWERIKHECDDCGVEYMCSPFSVDAAMRQNPLVKRWKIGSGNIEDIELVNFCISTGKPIIYSNGQRRKVPENLRLHADLEMACISKYPTPLDEAMALLDEVKHAERWGWSSHTGHTDDICGAIESGAAAIECHVCWDRRQSGPDVESSQTVSVLAAIVDVAKGSLCQAS